VPFAAAEQRKQSEQAAEDHRDRWISDQLISPKVRSNVIASMLIGELRDVRSARCQRQQEERGR
jgi:hypothetical protein